MFGAFNTFGKLGAIGKAIAAAWSPSALYAAGQVGAWYDPSDLATMFTDSAGTTPVVQPGTVADQPVGLILDKSPLGIDATQSTSTARPLLSARVNLLTYTEDFSNAVWVKDSPSNLTVTLNQPDPVGGLTAARLQATVATYSAFRYSDGLATDSSTRSFWIKSSTGAGGNLYLNDTQITLIADTEWHRYSIYEPNLFAWGTRIQFVEASSERDVFIAFAQKAVGNQLTTYQRVTTVSDYDGTPGVFPYYLKFDGVDDYLSTAAIDFTGTSKVMAISGTFETCTGVSMLYETSTNAISGGAFYCAVDYNAGGVGTWLISGNDAIVFATVADQPSRAVTTAEMSSVFTSGVGALSVNVNGVPQTLENTYNPSATSTGNFGNHPLFIGARTGPAYPFNGNLYSLIIAGALYDAATIGEAETWVAGKTGVTL